MNGAGAKATPAERKRLEPLAPRPPTAQPTTGFQSATNLAALQAGPGNAALAAAATGGSLAPFSGMLPLQSTFGNAAAAQAAKLGQTTSPFLKHPFSESPRPYGPSVGLNGVSTSPTYAAGAAEPPGQKAARLTPAAPSPVEFKAQVPGAEETVEEEQAVLAAPSEEEIAEGKGAETLAVEPPTDVAEELVEARAADKDEAMGAETATAEVVKQSAEAEAETQTAKAEAEADTAKFEAPMVREAPPSKEAIGAAPGEREALPPEEAAGEAALAAATGAGGEVIEAVVEKPAASADTPELAQWQEKVSEKTKAIKADGVGRSGVKHVRASGAAAAARAAEERRKQQQGAGNILPNPPEIRDPLLPPTHDPVPAATDLVRKASEMKLPNQTMPQLVKTKGNVMPAPPRAPSAEFGSKSVTTYGTEMEALDTQEKAATESKNRKELARIKKERKALEKKFKADWAEGQSEPLTLVEEAGPPPAAPMTEQTQADIGKVLATLTLMQETAAKDLVDEARRVTFPGGVLSEGDFDEDFGKEGLEIARPYLTRMIGEIGKAAHLGEADIQRYVTERTEALEKKTELLHAGLTDAAAFEKKKVLDLRQKQSNEAAGAEDAAQAHIKGLVSEFKTGVDPTVVLEKRKQLVTAVSRKQGQQTAAYERAGERREKALSQTHGAYLETYKNAVQTEKTNYFKAAWKARKNKAQEKVAAQAEAETQLAPTVSWLRDELVPDLDIAFARMKKEAAEAVTGFIANLKDALKTALEMIAHWADELTGNLSNFWIEIARENEDWALQAKESAKAWEAERAGAARDALIQDINSIRIQTRYEEDQLKQQQAAGAKKLSEQQAKVEQESIENPPGPKDAILTVAMQLKDRLSAEERPKLVERFEKKVWELGPEKWIQVDTVAQAVEPGGSVDKIGDKVRDAADRIGTLEDQIYEALADLGPLHAQALKLFYRKKYNSDIESVLKSELSGAEEDRALGLLNRDPGKAGAATIAYAINPAFPGGGNPSAVMEVLRTTQDPADLRAKFKAEYDIDLDEYLRRSLKGEDLRRAQALITGDKTTQYVTDLKHAVRSEDRKGLEAVYAQIHADVEKEAAKETEKVRGGTADRTTKEWDSQRIEEEVRKRAADVEKAYNKDALASAGILGTTLRDDIDKNLKGPERDLALALHESNPTRANAARLKLEDKGGKLKHNFWGVLEVTKGDSKAINNLLAANGERVRRDVERDEEIKLWNRRVASAREQQVAYLRGWSPAQIEKLPKWVEQKERDAFAKTVKEKTQEHKDDFKKTYEAAYGSIDAMLARNVTGDQWDKADHLVKQGGILRPEQTLHYAVVEKDADTVKSFVGGTSEKDMKEVEENWRKSDEGKKWLAAHEDEAGEKGFEKFVLSKFEGDDAFDIKLDITGRSDKPEEMLARKEQKLHRQKTQYLLASGDAFEGMGALGGAPPGLGEKDYELRHLEREVARLRGQVSKLKSLEKGSAAYDAAKKSYERQLDYIDRAVDSHRKAVDRRTDDAAMIVGIVVTAIVIVATGGAATPLLAAFAAGAGAAASIITKAIMKGGAYLGTKEMWTDIVVGVVDTIVSAATAGLGGRLLKGIRPLAQMSKSARLAPRLIAHGLAEGAENFVSTIPTSVAQQLMEKGDVSFSETFTGAAIGAGLGGVLGSVGGFKKPGAAVAGTADILAHRGTPAERLAGWQSFQKANPGKPYKDFLADLDAGILVHRADDEAVRQAQRNMRGELFADIPPAQHGQFKDVPIEVMSDADFARFTRSDLGEAVVIVVDGKPRVIMRESADIKVLRREGKHLLQSVDPDTAHLFRALDEKMLSKWDTLSLDEQFSLYGKKLDLEIDAQQRTLRDLEAELAAAGSDPAARRRILDEIDEVQETLDNLSRRAGEVADITPQQRRAWRRDPSLRPDYLDQPARLFEKKSLGREATAFFKEIEAAGLPAAQAKQAAADARAALKRLRSQAGGSKQLAKTYGAVAAKARALGPIEGLAYLKSVHELLGTRDLRVVADFLGATAAMKKPTALLDHVVALAAHGATPKLRIADDALAAVAKKATGMSQQAAAQYLADLNRLVIKFPKAPAELSGILNATAKAADPSALIARVKSISKEIADNKLHLEDGLLGAVGDRAGALRPKQAQDYLDALDGLLKDKNVTVAKVNGFLFASAEAADPGAYLKLVRELSERKALGLTDEAIEMLSNKARPRTVKGDFRGKLDLEWLMKTKLLTDNTPDAIWRLDFLAKEKRTPWDLFRDVGLDPLDKDIVILANKRARGIAGEMVGAMHGARLLKAEGVQLVSIVPQVKMGSSELDFLIETLEGTVIVKHGLEVKAFNLDTWDEAIDAITKSELGGTLSKAEEVAAKKLDDMVKQLQDAEVSTLTTGRPFLLVSDVINDLSDERKTVLSLMLGQKVPNVKVITMPEDLLAQTARDLRKSVGLPK